jgi:hypothetical protein
MVSRAFAKHAATAATTICREHSLALLPGRRYTHIAFPRGKIL